MNITNAKYRTDADDNNCLVDCTIDGEKHFVPMDNQNRHYIEILSQVAAGTLTIADADSD